MIDRGPDRKKGTHFLPYPGIERKPFTLGPLD
jgi:hypothetical protein